MGIYLPKKDSVISVCMFVSINIQPYYRQFNCIECAFCHVLYKMRIECVDVSVNCVIFCSFQKNEKKKKIFPSLCRHNTQHSRREFFVCLRENSSSSSSRKKFFLCRFDKRKTFICWCWLENALCMT